MSLWRDERRFHLITRGNVDGIVSAALFLAKVPGLKVSFVTSTSGALDALRRDIQSQHFYVVDLGASPELVRTVQQKTEQGAHVHILDHHQQTVEQFVGLPDGPETLAKEGVSAATLVYQFLGLGDDLGHLAAIADVVEYCESDTLYVAQDHYGEGRVADEARILDYAWRLQVDDDRFRMTAARHMAEGKWPSEVPEVKSRYLQVINEGRWERALDKVRSRMRIKNGVGVLQFGRYRTSLLGFGTRALSHVAAQEGCDVAVLLNSRKTLSSVSLRGVGPAYSKGALGPAPLNLGRFVEEFTLERGVMGGGHPSSAGAKIYTRDIPELLAQINALV